MTPDDALRQAHETAHEYARMGIKAFEDLMGISAANNPKATATFVAGFMQAASTDFAAWAIQRRLEEINHGLSNDFEDLVSILSNKE